VVITKCLDELLSISPPQSHQATSQLTEAGILDGRTGYRPFGEEPVLPDLTESDD
jgi:hypothetical protein